jgi:hypothetical protein
VAAPSRSAQIPADLLVETIATGLNEQRADDGYFNVTASNMATTSFTLVGNSADSRELIRCRDAAYGHASR